MARKPSERRHGKERVEDLNLSPIMSILVILIPMLLYAFSFFEVKVQAVTAPRMGPSNAKPKEEDEKKPLNLTVLVTSKGFVVKQQAELTTEPEKPIFKRSFNGGTEEYDFPALYSRLMAKKKQYPDESTINIGAEMDIPWHIIARTIDAARVQLVEDSYEDLKAYSEAKVKSNSKGEAVDLFPAVVFVVAE
ncbi:MAG: biopolymer transporter ExbD [Deltaproteobacteria bacterium]|nr:biopolymer transporter ExbD [Deltaproteobacteria bacterium]MCB9785555.1 biopolymer transporter ExbD [Deltaproteobacteria bacterium]